MTEIGSELIERGPTLWDELCAQTAKGPLPFVRFDPDDPGVVLCAWDVTESGNYAKDLTYGVFCAEWLVHCTKNVRLNCDPFLVISEVLVAISQKGNPGPIEVGFLSRIAMLAHAAALN